MYGLPTSTRKSPALPILSVTILPYHKLTRQLEKLLISIRKHVENRSCKDTFECIRKRDCFTRFVDFFHKRVNQWGTRHDCGHITADVEFVVNGTYYELSDSVATGGQLGPVLAGTIWDSLISCSFWRYVQDVFVIHDSESEIDMPNLLVCNVHPNNKFSMEIERKLL